MGLSTTDATILTPKRTTTFVVALMVALCSGTNYVYSVYGPQLGRRLQLSFANQNLVGLSGNYGVCLSAPFLGRLADTKGLRPCFTLAFILLLTGYFGIKAVYDSAEGSTEPAGYPTLFALVVFELFSGVGSEAGFCAAQNAVMKSFPDKIRTTVIGMLVSGFGLSASLFSTIAHTAFPGNTSGFLFTLGLGAPIPAVLGWFFIRICPYPERPTRSTSENEDREEPDETTQLLAKDTPVQLSGIDSLAMIRTVEFWILFWIMSLLAGSGIMWINNVGLMARALMPQSDTSSDDLEYVKWQTLHVTSFSIASCAGRIIIGLIADFVKHRGTRRIQCLSAIAVAFLLSHLAGVLVQDNQQLQYAVLFTGLSYGTVFGITPTIVVEWFGLAHVSANCGLITLSVLPMGNVFSMMFGRIFDVHSTPTDRGMRCLEGSRCYAASLYVTALAALCALILSRVAVRLDKKYKMVDLC